MPRARWFFRVIEMEDGRWACHRGPEQFDSHERFADALAHIRAIAADNAPAEVFVHSVSGGVQSVGLVD